MTVRAIVPRYMGLRRYPVRRNGGRSFDRLFGEFFNDFDRSLGQAFTPSLDVSETDAEIKIAAELPGLDEENIDVSLENDVLTISGEKKAEAEDKGENYHRIERSYGAFKRSVAMPSEVDAEKVEATFKNGVLTVTLPKSAEAQAKKIDVKAS